MACFHPMSGYRAESVNPDTGKRSIVFDRNKALGGGLFPVEFPCGQCIGCRLERARSWAARLVHEASLHDSNCFITLTYSSDNLPVYFTDDGPLPGTLQLKDFQDFMKRLRQRISFPVRFYHVGEYGENFGRPHYHCILFGYDFSDKEYHRTTDQGDKVYVSSLLSDIWGKGYCELGSVTLGSAGYVARYCVKKITGDRAGEHYRGRSPEYSTMSRRPGIGRDWLRKWTSDVFPSDSVVIAGKEMKVPKFYDRCFEIDCPDVFSSVKARRRATAISMKDSVDNGYERRLVREFVQERLVSDFLQRRFENGKA